MKWLSHDENEQYEIQRNVRGFQTSRNSFNGLNHDPQDVEGRLWQVGTAMHYFHRQGKKLTLTETDKSHLAKLLEIWADDPVPEQHSFWRSAIQENSTKQLTQNVTEALPPIIGEITVSQCLSDKIYEKMRQTDDQQTAGVRTSRRVGQNRPRAYSRRRNPVASRHHV